MRAAYCKEMFESDKGKGWRINWRGFKVFEGGDREKSEIGIHQLEPLFLPEPLLELEFKY